MPTMSIRVMILTVLTINGTLSSFNHPQLREGGFFVSQALRCSGIFLLIDDEKNFS